MAWYDATAADAADADAADDAVAVEQDVDVGCHGRSHAMILLFAARAPLRVVGGNMTGQLEM